MAEAPAQQTTQPATLPVTGTLSAAEIGNGVWWRPELDETSITLMLDNLARWNIQNVYVDVFRSGETLFPSRVFPQKEGAARKRDWLGEITMQAHSRGIRVHAWVQTLCVVDPEDGQSSGPHETVLDHPDWLDLPANGQPLSGISAARYLSPANAEVVSSLTSLTAELCQMPLDGINLDALCYNPLMDMGYGKAAVAEFRAKTGIDPTQIEPDMARDSDWMAWTLFREDKLTSLVQSIAGECRRQGAEQGRRIILSAIVQPGYEQGRGADFAYQHWSQWVDNDLLDATTPGCFHGDLPGLEKQLWEIRSIQMNSDMPCLPGLALDHVSRSRSVSPYSVAGATRSANMHPTLADQKRLLRNTGFRYYNVMDYRGLVEEMQTPRPQEKNHKRGFWDWIRGSEAAHEEPSQ